MGTTPSPTSTFKGLDATTIGDLLANTRTRNAYGPKVLEFVNSDEAAINPKEAWPEFAGKKAQTLYQGFRLAVEKADLTEQIMVKLHDENVYLLHKERVALVMADAADED